LLPTLTIFGTKIVNTIKIVRCTHILHMLNCVSALPCKTQMLQIAQMYASRGIVMELLIGHRTPWFRKK